VNARHAINLPHKQQRQCAVSLRCQMLQHQHHKAALQGHSRGKRPSSTSVLAHRLQKQAAHHADCARCMLPLCRSARICCKSSFTDHAPAPCCCCCPCDPRVAPAEPPLGSCEPFARLPSTPCIVWRPPSLLLLLLLPLLGTRSAPAGVLLVSLTSSLCSSRMMFQVRACCSCSRRDAALLLTAATSSARTRPAGTGKHRVQ
jgi:hypothetical protein